MASVLLIRPLCEGDEPEFAEPLGIERLAGYLHAHGVDDVRVFDRRLYVEERRAGAVGANAFGAGCIAADGMKFEARKAGVAGIAASRPNSMRLGAPETVDSAVDAPGFYDDVRAAYAENSGPTLIGLSLMTSADVPDARRIMSRLGAWWPDARFVAGGVFVTTAPDVAALKLPKGVVLMRGEGEVQLLELVRDASTRDDCGLQPASQFAQDRSDRVASRRAPSFPDDNAPQPALARPDTFALQPNSPDEWAIPYRPNLERYARLRCAVNVQTSRGCPGACAFCATPSLPRELRRWAPRDEALVLDEIQEAAERLMAAGFPPVFNFVDDDFGPLERLESFAEGLIARKLRIAFACEMRFASLAGQSNLAERLAHLHDAGLTRVFFGIESLDPATHSDWKKPMDLKALPHVLECFRTAGVSVQVGYILWHGAQTLRNAEREVDQLHEMGIYSHRAVLSRLIVFPGSALARGALIDGSSLHVQGALAGAPDSGGFEPMDLAAEEFHRRFSEAASELTQEWTNLAIAEPYTSAEAFLSGDDADARELRKRLAEVNEESYWLFKEMIS